MCDFTMKSHIVKGFDLLFLQGDDYNHIMVEALADRLAEAFAEKLHQIVRKELWGYAPDEDFSTEDLLKVKYQGRSARHCHI